MEPKLNTENADWSPFPYLDSQDVISVQRGPEPGGAGGAYRAFGETLRGLKTVFGRLVEGPATIQYPEVYEINLSRCIFCGYCEVACPFDAITMGHEYEISDYNRSDLIFTKEMLLADVVHLVSLAGLFLLLYAQFVAAVQVVVYAGAVMVLYVFVAAYVGGVEEPLWEPIPGQRLLAPLLAAALFIELSIAIIGTALTALDSEGPTLDPDFGDPASIGELFLERFLIAFEAASLLLLIAAVGAVVLAGRRQEAADGR